MRPRKFTKHRLVLSTVLSDYINNGKLVIVTFDDISCGRISPSSFDFQSPIDLYVNIDLPIFVNMESYAGFKVIKPFNQLRLGVPFSIASFTKVIGISWREVVEIV